MDNQNNPNVYFINIRCIFTLKITLTVFFSLLDTPLGSNNPHQTPTPDELLIPQLRERRMQRHAYPAHVTHQTDSPILTQLHKRVEACQPITNQIRPSHNSERRIKTALLHPRHLQRDDRAITDR